MATPKVVTIDFETERIQPRPHYPPKPVGVSIGLPGKAPRYYAWGHPTENNCTLGDAVAALRKVWKGQEGDLLFHNGKFDVDVAETHMGVGAPPDPLKVHDTQFLLFLVDPHSFDLGLKSSAERMLDMPPEEQDAVRDWLLDNQKALKARGLLPHDERITKGNFGAWIALAPGGLVARYAKGDVVRTAKLFKHLYPEVVKAGMLPAYRREQKIMPILLRNEREGMRCDVVGLERDVPLYETEYARVERWLCKRLKTDELPLTSPAKMAELLDSRGIITEWTLTATGKKSMSKKVIKPSMYTDAKVFLALGYLAKLQTCLQTYFRPWLEIARETGGVLHSGWNQTRNDRDSGTRTGRLSGSPNFMAVAKDFEDKGDGWSHPDFIKDLAHLPLMRKYILPDAKSHLWGRRDFNQQELRILGHFEDGKLMQAYLADPYLDVHAFVQGAIKEILGIELPRTPVKTLNFGLIYGQGSGSMAEKLNRTVEEVQQMRNAQFSALPGLKELDATIKARGRNKEPITTWGGRRYYAEDPKMIDGRWRSFEYKLLNYLIQGSAADCTKEALIRYEEIPNRNARFVVTVHDEINISADKRVFKAEMLKLREAMMSVEFDVPLLSDAEFGANWGALEVLKEPKPNLSMWSTKCQK